MQKRFVVAMLLMASTLMFSSCSKDGGILGGIFNKKGETVASSDLPPAILDYLNTHYPNFSIKKAEKETDDTGAVVFEIELETGEELTFDENGNFLGVENDDEDETESDSLSLADLPTTVQDYINTNYADFTFEGASQDTLCGGSIGFEVELQNGTTDIHLVFDESGNLQYQATSVTLADLPAPVTNSISSNYAAYTAEEDGYRLELPDGTLQYQIELNNTANSTDLEVTFGADGNIICEE